MLTIARRISLDLGVLNGCKPNVIFRLDTLYTTTSRRVILGAVFAADICPFCGNRRGKRCLRRLRRQETPERYRKAFKGVWGAREGYLRELFPLPFKVSDIEQKSAQKDQK
jgi:hypothetical protein